MRWQWMTCNIAHTWMVHGSSVSIGCGTCVLGVTRSFMTAQGKDAWWESVQSLICPVGFWNKPTYRYDMIWPLAVAKFGLLQVLASKTAFPTHTTMNIRVLQLVEMCSWSWSGFEDLAFKWLSTLAFRDSWPSAIWWPHRLYRAVLTNQNSAWKASERALCMESLHRW